MIVPGSSLEGVEALRLIERVTGALGRYVSAGRAFRILKEITLYHRIQGSPGLVEAARRLEEIIIDWAPDNVDTELILYTGRSGPEWLSLPASWSLESGRLVIGGRLYRTEDSPTLVAAHSPPSDGWVEGLVEKPSDPLDPDSFEAGKIYLITDHWQLAYRLAAERGAAGVILARKELNPEAFPYIGLFLSEEEARKYSTPAVTVPWRIAEELEGKAVRLRVDTTLGGPGRVPVLVAWIGEREGSGPVIMGHLCHPMPGANDNASGAAASMEAFIALAEAVDEGQLEPPGGTIRLVLMPEWTGTILSMEGWLGGLARAGVNLDMVGAAGHLGVGEASIYYPPGTAPEHRLADILVWTSRTARLGHGLKYYMFGSDHDVLLSYGVESEMINQWPDPRYHTSRDDADGISPERLARAALLGGAAAYLYQAGAMPPATPAVEVVSRVIAGHASRGDSIAARLAAYYLPARYGVEPLSRVPSDWRPPAGGERIRVRAGMRLMTVNETIRLLGLEGAVKLWRGLREAGASASVIRGELFFAAHRGVPLGGFLTLVAAAYGVEEMRRAVRALEALEEAGLVEAG